MHAILSNATIYKNKIPFICFFTTLCVLCNKIPHVCHLLQNKKIRHSPLNMGEAGYSYDQQNKDRQPKTSNHPHWQVWNQGEQGEIFQQQKPLPNLTGLPQQSLLSISILPFVLFIVFSERNVGHCKSKKGHWWLTCFLAETSIISLVRFMITLKV